MNGILYLEDGTVYQGKGFGKKGMAVGELVFNTSMTGYQEILTDPSYAGQVLMMTYPLIGNYGVNKENMESNQIYAYGLIVKSICKNPSHYTSEETVHEMLQNMDIPGVYGVDTRSIMKKIRQQGTMKCIISNEERSIDELASCLKETSLREDGMKEVSTKKVMHIPGVGPRVAILDFGIKKSILHNFIDKNCDVLIFPYGTSSEEILRSHPDGLFLSNGPGNPKKAVEAIETVKKLIYRLPIFGVGLGHQLLALSLGGNTYKMKYGHRGTNHGIYDKERDRAYVIDQNHGYAVAEHSIEDREMVITHRNLNDKTIEGIRHKSLPIFSVQFYPENIRVQGDSSYLFNQFISQIKEETVCL